MKVQVAVAEVSKGQLVLGVALTKRGAQAIADGSIHAASIFTATLAEKVKAGDRLVAHMVQDGSERILDYLSLASPEANPQTVHVVQA